MGLGVLCKNGIVRDKAQQISGYKLNSTKPCQASPYVNVCLIHTFNWTNSGMCNSTGWGCPGLCYKLLKGNPSLRLCHLYVKMYKMYYLYVKMYIDHWTGVKKVQIFQSRGLQREIHTSTLQPCQEKIPAQETEAEARLNPSAQFSHRDIALTQFPQFRLNWIYFEECTLFHRIYHIPFISTSPHQLQKFPPLFHYIWQ